MNHLVVQRVEIAALVFTRDLAFDVHAVDLRLRVQRVTQRVRVEEQLEDRVQQAANRLQQAAVRLVERRVLELERREERRLVRRLTTFELLEQIGPDAARIEELLQLHRSELAELRLGVIDAALLADARADLLHDLLDVDRVGADGEFSHEAVTSVLVRTRARPWPLNLGR